MLDSRDQGRDSDEDEVKSKIWKRTNATTSADHRRVMGRSLASSGCSEHRISRGRSGESQEEVPDVLRTEQERQKERVARMKKFVSEITMMMGGEVDIEGAHWCILVNESQQPQRDYKECRIWKWRRRVEVRDRLLSVRKEELVGEQGCGESEEQEESRGDGYLGEGSPRVPFEESAK